MSKTKNGKLSEKQLQRSWKCLTNLSIDDFVQNIVQKNQPCLTFYTENSGAKEIRVNSVTRVTAANYEFNADDYSNPAEVIHGVGCVHLSLDGKIEVVEFFAHSVALSNPGQSHDTVN